jgi:hypothetical protein
MHIARKPAKLDISSSLCIQGTYDSADKEAINYLRATDRTSQQFDADK